MKLIIFGPQGSGKGTQADMLAVKLNICHVTMGDIFREEVFNDSEIGHQIAEYLDKGELVPDHITLDLLTKKLASQDCSNGFVLDGYPRNLSQAKFLDEVTALDKALEIIITDKEATQRIAGRRTCSGCGKIYHLEFKPPQQEGVCDFDQGRLIVREDDKPEVIGRRLAVYHEQTEPIKEFYQEKGVYLPINGMSGIKEVSAEILDKLNIN